MKQFVWDPEVFEEEWGVLAMSAGVKIGGMGCGKLPVPQCSDFMRPQVNPPSNVQEDSHLSLWPDYLSVSYRSSSHLKQTLHRAHN